MLRRFALLAVAALCGAFTGTASSAELRVAVAANFRYAMQALSAEFEQHSEHAVVEIYGSTGKLFAQIEHGAPFDVFLAADELRPRMLEEDGIGISGSRFVYALGQLVLWTANADADVDLARLEQGDFRFLAIANPTLAPYGRAAREVLVGLGVWERLYPRIVQGENVGQAYQFVISGNADLGLIALAQVQLSGGGRSGTSVDIPQSLYRPIRQQAMLLTDTPASRAFIEYLRSDDAARIIRSFGYRLPEHRHE